MQRRATHSRQGIKLGLLLGTISILTWGTSAWASTRFGPDIEVQAWYRMRHTFQTDGTEHFDWVQWRNEAYVWLIYNNIVKNNTLRPFNLDWHIPFVENLAFSGRYRARVDPVYYLRKHYRNLYDEELRQNFFKPEDGFRDIHADMDHGKIGPGRLSSRIGFQQIVWGESDLYRSLDIINPLRIDQNFAIGEKFDEFRSPILAFKFFYDIGNVGESFSNVGIETFYTPRYRSGATDLIQENAFRVYYQADRCLTPDGQLLTFSYANCGQNDTRFLPRRPNWVGQRRFGHPWSFFGVGPNGQATAADYFCITGECRPEVAGERGSVIYNIHRRNKSHLTRGTSWNGGMLSGGGVRIVGTTWFGAQVSLNYLLLPLGPTGEADANGVAEALTEGRVYGSMPFGGVDPSGPLEEGLRRCLSASGKNNSKGRNNDAVILTGSDLYGYDWPERRLDANGNPLRSAKQKQAARTPITLCVNPYHKLRYSNILGFTMTYNDFDYTGAVIRLEQSVSTREGRNKFPGRTTKFPHIVYTTPVWRSMVGFDLFSSLSNYPGMGWTRNLPGDFGTQASFLSFQWLMMYVPSASNTFSYTTNCTGTGRPSPPGPQPGDRPGCTNKHWNHFFTLGFAGQGYFKSKLEQRTAVAFEPRGKQWLLYGQWWWRDFFSLPVDLSAGVSWFPSSRMDHSWTALNFFTERNLLWFEATYYLL